MTAPPAAAIEVRRLTYADLPRVVAIERRAYRTPWSLAMFVLELSKASGICLAAFVEGDLAGYLVCSRYDTVWHLMNVAVDPDRRRHGIAATLLTRLFERVDDPDAQYTLEVRQSNEGALALYDRFRFQAAGVRRRYYADNGEDAVVMWRTPATLRGSLDDVPNAPAALILAIETSCDDTCAAVVTGAGEVLASVVSSQGVHDRYGGVVPEIASRHHLELVNAVVDDALRRADRDARRRRARRRHAGPRSRRRAAGRRRDRQGARRRARAAARAGRPPPGPRGRQLPRPDAVEPPFLCLIASGGHTLLVAA